MTVIRFGEGLSATIEEMFAALKKCVADANNSVRAIHATRTDAEKLREILDSRREDVEKMAANCREKLISVNNILAYEQDETGRLNRTKEKLETILETSKNYLPVLEKCCVHIKGVCEKLEKTDAAALRNAEVFLKIAEAGGMGLIKVQSAVVEYATLPVIGEIR